MRDALLCHFHSEAVNLNAMCTCTEHQHADTDNAQRIMHQPLMMLSMLGKPSRVIGSTVLCGTDEAVVVVWGVELTGISSELGARS